MPKCRACGKTIGFRMTSNNERMPVKPGIEKFIDKHGEIVEGQAVHWCKEWEEQRKSKGKPKPVPRSRSSKPVDDEVPF